MKNTFKSRSKICLVLMSILFCIALIHGCKKENLTTKANINSIASAPAKDIIEKINFNSFLSETKNLKSSKLNLLINKVPDQGNLIKLSSVDTYDGLTLFTDSIRKINHGEHITYTFPVKQINPSYLTFQNFVVDVKNDEITNFLISYTPDSAFLKSFFSNTPGFFSGKVKAEIFNSEVQTGPQVQTVKPQLVLTTCETLIFYDVRYAGCEGKGVLYHSYENRNDCAWNGQSNGPHMYTSAVPITTCESVDIGGDTGGGAGGGGGSGGGGDPYVTPVTPPNYNPCPPTANVSSIDGKKTNLVPGGGSGCPVVTQPVFTPPTMPAVLNQIKNKPFVLYDIPCEVIKKWLATARFVPDNTIISKLNSVAVKATTSLGTGAPGFTSTDIAHVQKIDDAFSSVVNMDYFPVTISQLPIVNGQRLSADQFLQLIRLNINNFINDNKTFIPYNYNGIDDRAKWNSNDPKGALVAIDLAGPDNATVITSYAANDRWTFTTIYDPSFAGEHPVSGNRNFGYAANADGSYTFYTQGVDRLTTWDGVLAQSGPELINEYLGIPINGVPFTMADNLWKSFQNKITNFVTSNGGNAKVDKFETYRPNWDLVKEVLQGKKPLRTLSKDCPN